jgi:hypothetical protein
MVFAFFNIRKWIDNFKIYIQGNMRRVKVRRGFNNLYRGYLFSFIGNLITFIGVDLLILIGGFTTLLGGILYFIGFFQASKELGNAQWVAHPQAQDYPEKEGEGLYSYQRQDYSNNAPNQSSEWKKNTKKDLKEKSTEQPDLGVSDRCPNCGTPKSDPNERYCRACGHRFKF